jgi:hypothetical protein
MLFVEARLNTLDLLNHVADMRGWLERNGAGAAGFSYREYADRLLVRVAFKTKAAADGLAACFAGRVISDLAPSPAQAAPAADHGIAIDRRDSV